MSPLIAILLSSWFATCCYGQAESNGTTAGCRLVFTAETMSDVFTGSCSPVEFPCTEAGLLAVPGDCSQYYQCANLIIYQCSCSDGTAYDFEQKNCVETFYANCTCPNVYLPTTPEQPTTTMAATTTSATTTTTLATTTQGTEAPAPQKSNTGAIVGGVIGAIVCLCLLAAIIVFICWRKRSEPEKTLPPASGSFHYDNGMYNRSLSDGSTIYSSIKERDMTVGRMDPLPAIPAEGLYADNTPAPSTTEEQGDDDASTEPVYDNKF